MKKLISIVFMTSIEESGILESVKIYLKKTFNIEHVDYHVKHIRNKYEKFEK